METRIRLTLRPALLAALGALLLLCAAAAPAAAAAEQSLGFNNARQMAWAGDALALVWVDDAGSRIVVGTLERDAGGFSRTTTVASGSKLSQPAIASSGETLAVAWVAGGRVHVRIRIGGRWLPVETVGTGSAPSLAVAGGYLGVAWHSGASVLFARRPLTASGAWSGPQTLAAAEGDTVSFASLTRWRRGFVAVWKRGGAARWSVELSRSTAAGERWTEARTVGEGADPAVCATGRTLWVAYQQPRGGILAARSTDGGRTFSAYEVGEGWFAHVSCHGGGVVVAWERTSYPPRHPDVTKKSFGLAYVTAAGRVVSQPAPASSSVAAPTALAVGGRVVVAWIESGERALLGSLHVGEVALRGLRVAGAS